MTNDRYQPELFGSRPDPVQNLLPYDGTVNDYGSMRGAAAAQRHFLSLLQVISWQNDVVLMYGKRITSKRKLAWYADDALDHSYSGVRKAAIIWTPELLDARNRICGSIFQFLNGSIKRRFASGVVQYIYRFQFLNGSIKSFDAGKKLALEHYFNS